MTRFLLLTDAGAFVPGGPDPRPVPAAELPALLAAHGTPPVAPSAPSAIAPTLHYAPARPAASWGPDDEVAALLPRVGEVRSGGVALFDHRGEETGVIDADEVHALLALADPVPAAEAAGRVATALGARPDRAEAILARLHALGLVGRTEPAPGPATDPTAGVADAEILRRVKTWMAGINERLRQPDPDGTTAVIPVSDEAVPFNLALGLLLAHGAAYDGGRLTATYHFLPAWLAPLSMLERRLRRRGPAVLLFSNYVWSIEANLEKARRLKEVSPDSIMIHGGPSTPKYEHDAEAFFAAHPGVDIAVRGEGEQTLVEILDALGGRLAGRGGDLSALAAVPGLTYRTPDGVVRTADRERMAELDQVPSPYRAGLFDGLPVHDAAFLTVETNRGCPYGCTFCDWGSATNSRIRKFDLQRVVDEIEWGARHGLRNLFICDANFGIFARDVEIAEAIVACKERYGVPTNVGACFAKNTTKYVAQIYSLFWHAGIAFDPIVALQSMDDEVLAAVDRSNIKVQAYDDLADHLRALGATVGTELMMGLPGSSPASFADDLQGCIDRELFATIYDTMMLPNSPMNAPEYRDRWAIEIQEERVGGTGPESTRTRIAVATATYTRDDRQRMARWRRLFRVLEDTGLLRHVTRWVRQETGTREIDICIRAGEAVAADPDRFPHLAFVVEDMARVVEPLSWRHYLDDVERLLVEELGLPPDPAMATVLQVQAALLPGPRRVVPLRVPLAHDYAAWWAARDAALRARLDWVREVPRLATFPPAEFEVSGTDGANRDMCGAGLFTSFTKFAEFDSPVMRGARTVGYLSGGGAVATEEGRGTAAGTG